MPTTTNRAAWQPAKMARSFEVKSAPYTSPAADLITIKTHAVAINPVDYFIQQKGDIMYTWLKYPCILGIDVAGEVVEVGKNVTQFRIGDRVLGFARGQDKDVNSASQGGFQHYTVLEPHMTSRIPSTLSYQDAAVIPLGAGTAAAALFQKDQLALQLPTLKPTPTGKTLLIWGGSTSVGCNAIQLGVAAGYEVFTTCSPRNFDYVTKLGASKAFDYNSKTVIADLIAAFKGKISAGALSMGNGGAEACMAVLATVQGNKFVAMATYPNLQEEPKNLVFLRTVVFFVSWMAKFKIWGMLKGVKSAFIWGSSISQTEVGNAIFEDFLPQALEVGSFVAAPEAVVVGKGLEAIQAACEYQQKGVSAKKVVVLLD